VRFYLGTHQPHWLRSLDVPLFVSRRRLVDYKTLPVAKGRWALDSGGFTELLMHGRWTMTAAEYAIEVRRFRDEIGGLDWAAPQDWMCEPQIIHGGVISGRTAPGTGLDCEEHQRRTVANLIELRALAPDLPWVPVLQGWTIADYLRCIEMYDRGGVDLRQEPLIGLGSVCRRSRETEGAAIVQTLASMGLRLHGFGFKLTGLAMCGRQLASADSLAWSYSGRKAGPCPRGPKNCANCLHFALAWRQRVLAAASPRQQELFTC
jgi:hypothetical protein